MIKVSPNYQVESMYRRTDDGYNFIKKSKHRNMMAMKLFLDLGDEHRRSELMVCFWGSAGHKRKTNGRSREK